MRLQSVVSDGLTRRGTMTECEYCGRSFDHLGVRASKQLRKHQEFHGCPDAPDDDPREEDP
jgi:hypothetical protein